MKQSLLHIVQGLDIINADSLRDMTIDALTSDSRKALEGGLFFALKGTQTDGHNYLVSAQQSGCQVAIVEEIQDIPNLLQIQVKDSHQALSICAENFYDKPSQKLTLVGITGTNGKTTTTTLLHDLFTKLGYTCGLLSTVVNKIGQKAIPSTHTTPDPISLSALLNQMVEEGCTHAFMEVSSHALHQKRVYSLDFDVAVFTNITHDHLDYHKTFSEYIGVKKSFFDSLSKNAFAITNIDDKNGRVMVQNTAANIKTYALKSPADFKVKILENQISGLSLKLDGVEIWSQLIGQFNAYNLCALYAVTQVLDEPKMEVLRVISELKSVDGRFQQFKSANQVTCIVDYAHTPDALENVLETIESFQNVESIITVVGCGGDRDKTKRPEMAKIAVRRSSQVVLTSDNPRTENPSDILKDMEAGLKAEDLNKTLTIEDRHSAIKTAIRLAKPGSVLLIAGKGHEKYQEINGVKHPFDDFAIAQELFNQINS